MNYDLRPRKYHKTSETNGRGSTVTAVATDATTPWRLSWLHLLVSHCLWSNCGCSEGPPSCLLWYTSYQAIRLMGKVTCLQCQKTHFLNPLPIISVRQLLLLSTGLVCRMPHRKRRESKQHPSRAKSGHQLSCCLLSLHFLWCILCTSTVLV